MMEIVAVSEVINENKNIKTIKFNWPRAPRPGQFVMVWLPGIDEIPMSLSYQNGITVLAIGEATKALHGLKPGDKIGIKGPLGNGFDLTGARILAVGGGSGTAALAMAVEKALLDGREVTCAIGAKTADELLFADRLEEAGADVKVATDDGSRGHKGFVTELAREILSESKFDSIISCGPEPMLAALKKAADEAGVKCQLSLERYMKCGIGLCGSCQCGKFTVCGDGPVFSASELASSEDFGKKKRDPSGRVTWF